MKSVGCEHLTSYVSAQLAPAASEIPLQALGTVAIDGLVAIGWAELELVEVTDAIAPQWFGSPGQGSVRQSIPDSTRLEYMMMVSHLFSNGGW